MGPRGVAWPLGPYVVICVMDVWIIRLRLVRYVDRSDSPGVGEGRGEEDDHKDQDHTMALYPSPFYR